MYLCEQRFKIAGLCIARVCILTHLLSVIGMYSGMLVVSHCHCHSLVHDCIILYCSKFSSHFQLHSLHFQLSTMNTLLTKFLHFKGTGGPWNTIVHTAASLFIWNLYVQKTWNDLCKVSRPPHVCV